MKINNSHTRPHSPTYLIFILSLSILSIAMLTFDTIFPVSADVRIIIEYADVAICTFFFLDFLILLYRAENKTRYLITWGWLDLISSVPSLDYLRWGRSARMVRIIRVLRGIRSSRVLSSFILERRAQSTFLAAVLVSIILVTITSISILHFETVPGANIKTPEDAIWWALVTITTVGYGDRFPVTSEGRILGVILMMAGVGMFSTLSGFIAAWFLSPAKTAAETDLKKIENEILELRKALENK